MKAGRHIAFLLTLLITGCVLLVSCKNEISDIRAITDVSNLPVQTTYIAEYIFSEKGKVRNKLIASKIEQYQNEEEYIEATNGFVMIFYDTLEVEEARLQAQRGVYYGKEKKLIARDSVQLFNIKGEKLETEELIFLEDSAHIFTEKFVKITTANGSTLYGHGLESNDSFTKWRIRQPHNSELMINEENNVEAD